MKFQIEHSPERRLRPFAYTNNSANSINKPIQNRTVAMERCGPMRYLDLIVSLMLVAVPSPLIEFVSVILTVIKLPTSVREVPNEIPLTDLTSSILSI